MKKLFKRLEESDGGAEQKSVFEELAASLVAHDAIERQIFYPACEKAMGMTEQLGEALVEGKKDFKFKCTVLREVLEHHIEEEDDEFFPEAEKALGEERLEELGAEMEQTFEEALEEDFREPLHENLKQVLAFAIKPTPERKGGARRKKSASRATHARAHR